MKKSILLFLLFPLFAVAQINVSYQVSTVVGIPISPTIYGMCNGGYSNATVHRQGGNRMTGYNWENNASNAGADYFHQSDAFLPWAIGIPAANYNQPAIVTTTFHDNALAHQALSFITLPMAGYVANDMNGTTVETWESAPSNRWAVVENQKPSAFSLTPDLNDGVVYVDEFINFLQVQYGNSSSPTGVKAYLLDNEPGLWTSTHPRLYTGSINCTDHLIKSLSLARRVRALDPQAKIIGPEAYGYNEYVSFQGAVDWSTYSSTYSHYLALYLDSMKVASTQSGNRLLDVLSVHWYPDVYAGSVFSQDISPAIVHERMQIPRSLWDSSYVENGWIGQWFSQDLPILPKLKSLINTYYPGTELGVTEYDYGGDTHISGGIAQVEALGAFAQTGIHYATKWGEISEYSLAGFQLYRDVAEPFGDQLVKSASSDKEHSSIFSSIYGTNDEELHLIVTNKSVDSTIMAQFAIAAASSYDSIRVYFFDSNSSGIQTQDLQSSILQSGGFDYILQPLTAYHFVLKTATATNELSDAESLLEWKLFPNPATTSVQITWNKPTTGIVSMVNLLGQEITSVELKEQTTHVELNTNHLISGTYFVIVKTQTKTQQLVLVIQ